MSHDLTETPSFVTPIIVPDPGDPAQAGVVSAALSALANRSQYVKQYTDKVATGVRRLYTLTMDQMIAVTGVVNGDVVLVPEQGLFTFYADDPTNPDYTADGIWIIASTGIANGKWLNIESARVNRRFAAIGPTTMEPTVAANKIKQSLQTNYLYAMARMPTTGTLNTLIESPGTAEIGNTRFSLSVVSGDRILFNLGPINFTNNRSTLQYVEFRYTTNNWSSWGVLERFLVRTGNSELSAAINAPINFTGTMLFSLWGITDGTDALVVSTTRTYTSDMGMYTLFRA